MLALTRPVTGSLVLNVCKGQAIALAEMIRVMGAITGRALAPTRQPPREGDIRHSLGSPTAAQQQIGFSSADSIETGLRSFLASPARSRPSRRDLTPEPKRA